MDILLKAKTITRIDDESQLDNPGLYLDEDGMILYHVDGEGMATSLDIDDAQYTSAISPREQRALVSELQAALHNHDWAYIYSSDSSAYNKGLSEKASLDTMIAKLGTIGRDMYMQASKSFWGQGEDNA